MSRILEPSLLNVFRIYVVLRVVMGVFFALNYFTLSGGLFQLISTLNITLSIALLLYLSSNTLKYQLRHLYLPTAVVAITLMILSETRLFQWGIAQGEFQSVLPPFLGARLQAVADSNVFPLLVIFSVTTSLVAPVVLVSWQYSFRTVLFYIVGIAVFDLLLLLIVPIKSVMGLELLGILTRSSSFCIVGYIVSQLVATQRRQQAVLETSNKELARYATTQEKLVVSQERNRLARELHDTLAHTMSAVTVKLNAIDTIWERDSQRARTMLSEVITAMNEGMVETRRALRDLRATPLDDLGLVLAVCHLAEIAAERGGFTLHLHIPNKDLRLSPDVELGIYRIAQEALNNIVKHADANNVNLTLEGSTGHFRLCVQDNGVGFDEKTVHQDGHLGLKGMQERAKMFGADLKIISVRHQGTTVELCLEQHHDSRTHL